MTKGRVSDIELFLLSSHTQSKTGNNQLNCWYARAPFLHIVNLRMIKSSVPIAISKHFLTCTIFFCLHNKPMINGNKKIFPTTMGVGGWSELLKPYYPFTVWLQQFIVFFIFLFAVCYLFYFIFRGEEVWRCGLFSAPGIQKLQCWGQIGGEITPG